VVTGTIGIAEFKGGKQSDRSSANDQDIYFYDNGGNFIAVLP